MARGKTVKITELGGSNGREGKKGGRSEALKNYQRGVETKKKEKKFLKKRGAGAPGGNP